MITISTDWIYPLFCMTLRLGMVFLFAPIKAFRQLPASVRILLALSISILVLSSQQNVYNHNPSDMEIFKGALSEIAYGLSLTLCLQTAFAVFQMAGYLIDSQTGLNAMSVFNPAEHIQDPLTGHLFSLLAVLIFLTSDSHHLLIRGLMMSSTQFSPGSFLFSGGIPFLVKQGTQMFIFSVILASPTVTGLLAIEMTSALLTRNMPQINIWFLTVPVKIVAGLLFMQLTIHCIKPLMHTIFEACFHAQEGIFS